MTFPPSTPKHQNTFELHGYKNLADPSNGLFQYAYDCKGQVLFDYFVKVAEIGRRLSNMMKAWSVGTPVVR
jgi:hypothetical protein